MTKVDFKRELACYRATRDIPQVLTVPEMQYLMVDGRGDPITSAFADATAALYPVAYTLKFASKRDLGRDYVVMPLEGLWWADDMGAFTGARDKTRWKWTIMIMVPDWITGEQFATARDRVAEKSRVAEKGRTDRLDHVRLEALDEGLCVQALHVGSYDDEAGLLERMHHTFIPDQGLVMTGRHHEIYLSDARRVEPAKLRTILRQPVREAPGRD